MTHGQIKFGYTVEAPTEWPELLHAAQELDQRSNFDSFWIADSLVANGPLDEPKLDSWTALAAIGQVTSRIRLGVHVSGNAYRHPAVLAKAATTIDHISRGRVMLGIGAGWPGENRRYGVDFWTRPERVERLDEALDVIKLLWTQTKPVYEGKYYRLDAPPYSPGNVQQPHPPILVGGGSDAMLRVIAKHADMVSLMVDLKVARSKVEGYCHKVGRDPKNLRWEGGGQLFLNDDPDVQERAVRWAMEQYKQTEDEIRGQLFGSLEHVRRRVRDQIAEGADDINVFQLPRIHMKSLLRFSDEVIREFL
jgi:alkanesulfonate monooxygenase SsuD/methylene tetrahydromethanopterin reductase-like flavin-dependent oxidoreductase (luciferase family)